MSQKEAAASLIEIGIPADEVAAIQVTHKANLARHDHRDKDGKVASKTSEAEAAGLAAKLVTQEHRRLASAHIGKLIAQLG